MLIRALKNIPFYHRRNAAMAPQFTPYFFVIKHGVAHQKWREERYSTTNLYESYPPVVLTCTHCTLGAERQRPYVLAMESAVAYNDLHIIIDVSEVLHEGPRLFQLFQQV